TSISYSPEFEAAHAASDRDSHQFSQSVTARYVEMTISDNWRGFQGGTPGGDRVGLGEVAFEDSVPPVDPRVDLPSNLNLDLDGSVQTIDVPISNLGATQSLTILSTSLGGANATAFSVTSAPASIAPGASTVIQLSFDPSGLSGNITADLIVGSNDAETPSATVTMSGFLYDPKLSAPDALDFGNYPSGAGAQSRSVVIANDGGGQNLNISSTAITGPSAANFSITSAPTSLAPLTDGSIQLAFDPMGNDGSYSAQLEIASNDALVPTRIVNLSARVGDAIPDSGLRINEFMASNGSTIDDGDGNSSDWIEIFNAGPGSADLGGWHLTDNAGNLSAWEFPAGTILEENGYMLIFASGLGSGSGYTDGGGFLHTNFKLSTSGEYLGLVRPDGATIVSEFAPTFPAQFGDISYGTYSGGGSTTNLIAGSNADVLVPPDGSLAQSWTGVGFDSSGWENGPGNSVGFENSGTDYLPYFTIDVKDEFFNVDSSLYMRIPFSIEDKSLVQSISLNMRYDDGFVAYLNGNLLTSRNAPASPLWNNNASASHEASSTQDAFDVTASLGDLLNGENVLAIQGLNRTNGSSDFLIEPELSAAISGTGPLSVGYLVNATPGSPNSGDSANPGPEISDVSHTPTQPTEDQAIIVTAKVEPRLAQISGVQLHYRVIYGAETTIEMANTGGDNYTATIPASAFGSEDMVRWRVTSTDTGNNVGVAPPFLDKTGNGQSPEYFGTVTQDPSVTSDLPIFQWFCQNTSAAHNRTGARASVYFAGRFYDNIYVRQRGGATNGSISQKFDFNKGDPFYASEEMPSVGEININGNGADTTYVRQPLSFDTHREAGVASCISELWQLRDNATNDRVGVFIEQVDEDFLSRNGYDRDGDLYKLVQRRNLDPVFNDIVTGIEKKTNDKSDLSTLGAFVAGLNLPTSAGRRAYVIDHIDLPQMLNYLAVRSIIQDADDLRKNFYVYSDIHGDGRWRIFPWDKDYTYGVRGDGGTHLPHPFFGDEEHKKQNADQWNVLYDVLFEETTTQRLYL
ncbi:MAG: CotH kinase family protein, partial [Verrucomicrobiales bacterium]